MRVERSEMIEEIEGKKRTLLVPFQYEEEDCILRDRQYGGGSRDRANTAVGNYHRKYNIWSSSQGWQKTLKLLREGERRKEKSKHCNCKRSDTVPILCTDMDLIWFFLFFLQLSASLLQGYLTGQQVSKFNAWSSTLHSGHMLGQQELSTESWLEGVDTRIVSQNPGTTKQGKKLFWAKDSDGLTVHIEL